MSDPLWVAGPSAISAATTAIATAAAGAYAYRRFIHRRAFTPHVQIRIEGAIRSLAGVRTAIFTLTIENPGDAMFTIVPTFSAPESGQKHESQYSGVRVDALSGADLDELSRDNRRVAWDFVQWNYGVPLGGQWITPQERYFVLLPGRLWDFSFVVPIPWEVDVALVSALVGVGKGAPENEHQLDWRPKVVERFGAEKVLLFDGSRSNPDHPPSDTSQTQSGAS